MKSILVTFIFFIVLPSALAGHSLKIIGGQNAKPHEFPYVVAVHTFTPIGINSCGGTILSDLFILTAAHCIYNRKLTEIFIIAGKHNISAVEQTEQFRYPAKCITHEGFDYSGPFDIGLIKLDKLLDFTGAVKPISLPKRNIMPSESAIIIGWGLTNSVLLETSQILQKVIVPIVPNDVCAEAWQDFLGNTNDKLLCTGPFPGKISACHGDSGGPLVVGEPGSRTVVGIVSLVGKICDPNARPSVFTSVYAYIDWINKNMN